MAPFLPRLQLLPVSSRTANAFVQEHHRPVQREKFALAVNLGDMKSEMRVPKLLKRPRMAGMSPKIRVFILCH